MAITELNDYTIGDVNFNTMMETLDKTFKGKADISLSEYDTTAAPDVKAGSVFENNGSLYKVDSSDVTPTGYSGISNSTTFYLYYDADSTETFIYVETVPTWDDALQGWYNGNNRAFFSMYKDSGGTLYENKRKFEKQIQKPISLSSKLLEIGDWDMDASSFARVDHELLDHMNIRSVSFAVRDDEEQYIFPSPSSAGSYGSTDSDLSITGVYATYIELSRANGSLFDSNSYDRTSYNRGWVLVWHVE